MMMDVNQYNDANEIASNDVDYDVNPGFDLKENRQDKYVARNWCQKYMCKVKRKIVAISEVEVRKG